MYSAHLYNAVRPGDLVKGIKSRCSNDLCDIFGDNYIKLEDQLPYIVGYLFRIASSGERMVSNKTGLEISQVW